VVKYMIGGLRGDKVYDRKAVGRLGICWEGCGVVRYMMGGL